MFTPEVNHLKTLDEKYFNNIITQKFRIPIIDNDKADTKTAVQILITPARNFTTPPETEITILALYSQWYKQKFFSPKYQEFLLSQPYDIDTQINTTTVGYKNNEWFYRKSTYGHFFPLEGFHTKKLHSAKEIITNYLIPAYKTEWETYYHTQN